MKDSIYGPWASDKLDPNAFVAAHRARVTRSKLLQGADQAEAKLVFSETDRTDLRNMINATIAETSVALPDERTVMQRMFDQALDGSIHGDSSSHRVRPDSWQALADALDAGILLRLFVSTRKQMAGARM